MTHQARLALARPSLPVLTLATAALAISPPVLAAPREDVIGEADDAFGSRIGQESK